MSPAVASGRVRGRPTEPRTRIFLSTGMNCGLSAAWPAVRTNAGGRHLRSAGRWTLLVRPPLERPRREAFSRSLRRRRMRRRSSRSRLFPAPCPSCHPGLPPFDLAFPSSTAAFSRQVSTSSLRRVLAGVVVTRAVVESTLSRDGSISPRCAASAISSSRGLERSSATLTEVVGDGRPGAETPAAIPATVRRSLTAGLRPRTAAAGARGKGRTRRSAGTSR